MAKTSTISILTKKRGNALRRAETAERALDRIEDTKERGHIYWRRQRYLDYVARLTLQIEALRALEGKEVRVLGSLAT
jgi:hypothetical protein